MVVPTIRSPTSPLTRWGLTFSHAQGTIVGIPDLTYASTQVQNGGQVSATANPATVSFNIEIGEMSADLVDFRVNPENGYLLTQ